MNSSLSGLKTVLEYVHANNQLPKKVRGDSAGNRLNYIKSRCSIKLEFKEDATNLGRKRLQATDSFADVRAEMLKILVDAANGQV